MKIVLATATLLIFSATSWAQEQITPSHVFQKAQQIVVEISAIREAQNISTTAREPGVQANKRPLHVYSKSLEVIEKIGRYQDSIDMERVNTNQIPLRNVTPSEVYEQADLILTELSRIRKFQNLLYSRKTVSFIAGKGPSDVYEIMWKASYLLDALAGQTSPNEVFLNTQYILEELSLISENLGADIDKQNAALRVGTKTPEDVNIEAYKTLHKIGRLQRHLDVAPISPSPFPPGKITPNDALDTTKTILAELVRVKIALGIKTMKHTQAIPLGKNPDAVFDQMLLISAHLKPILAATNDRNSTGWVEAATK